MDLLLHVCLKIFYLNMLKKFILVHLCLFGVDENTVKKTISIGLRRQLTIKYLMFSHKDLGLHPQDPCLNLSMAVCSCWWQRLKDSWRSLASQPRRIGELPDQ